MADFTAGMGAGAYLQISMQEVGTSQAGNYSLVNWQFYLVCNNGASWNANATGWSATIAGQGFGGNYTYDFRGSNVKLIASGQVAVGHDVNGYGSCYGSGYTNYTGSSIGGPGSVGGTIGLSRIPKVPSSPGISVASVVGRTVSITVTAPGDDGGSGITQYTVQYSLNGGAWTGSQYGGSTVYNNLAPGNYQFRAYATNGVGDGSAALTGNVVVKAGGKAWNGTTWVADTVKVWNGTAWVDGTVKVWNGTAWTAAL